MTRIPLAVDLPITLLIFSTGTALGWHVLRGLRVPISVPLQRGIFAATLGLGLLCYLPFLLFAAGVGSPRVVASVTLCLFLLLLPAQWRIWRAVISVSRQSLHTWVRNGPDFTWLLVLAVTPKLIVVFLKALCPPTDPDGLHYHLTAPLKYLDAGRFEYLPTYLHLNWPMAVEMLFGIGMAFHRHYAASIVEFGFGVLLLLSLYSFGKSIASPTAGWIAAVTGFYLFRGLMSMAYIDIGLSQFILLATYALYLGWHARSEESTGAACVHAWWNLSALLAGMTAATKLTGIVWGIVLAAVVFMLARHAPAGTARTGPWRIAFIQAVRYASICILFVAPWYVRAWVMTGDPMYPFLWKWFHPIDWDADAHRRLTEYLRDFITLPSMRLTPAQVAQVKLISGLVVLLAGLIFLSRPATHTLRPLSLFTVAALALQVLLGGIYLRYLIPLLLPLILVILWVVDRMLLRHTWARTVAGLLLVGLHWGEHHLLHYPHRVLAEIQQALPVVLGRVSREQYLARRLPNFPILEWANHHLPPGSNVVMGLWHGVYGSLLHHRSMGTNLWLQNALRFSSWNTLLSDLARHNATHLLVEHRPPPSQEQINTMTREEQLRATVEFPLLERLRTERGELLVEMGNFALYQLRLGSTNPPTNPGTSVHNN
ncbi:MAG: DUF1420 family protein [Chloroherpetonaceae bacterium]|nr:DUF1420 family protein [Chthonomonadaceae bacterium]MDW8209003.1 DUF1420 family protein [Chloroherpetonaceae bacterium]